MVSLSKFIPREARDQTVALGSPFIASGARSLHLMPRCARHKLGRRELNG